MTDKRSDMMPLWTDAYLADTTDLDAIQHGMYFLLMMRAWRSGEARLKDDERTLSNIAKVSLAQWRKHSPAVMAYWTLKDGYWTQKRIEKEWSERLEFRKSQSERGKKSAQSRKNSQKQSAEKGNENNETDPTKADAEAVAVVKRKSLPLKLNQRSVSQSERVTTDDEDFERFWKVFPHAQASSQRMALDAWQNLTDDDCVLALEAAEALSHPPRDMFGWTWLAERHFAFSPTDKKTAISAERPSDPVAAEVFDAFEKANDLGYWRAWIAPDRVTYRGRVLHPPSPFFAKKIQQKSAQALAALDVTIGAIEALTERNAA